MWERFDLWSGSVRDGQTAGSFRALKLSLKEKEADRRRRSAEKRGINIEQASSLLQDCGQINEQTSLCPRHVPPFLVVKLCQRGFYEIDQNFQVFLHLFYRPLIYTKAKLHSLTENTDVEITFTDRLLLYGASPFSHGPEQWQALSSVCKGGTFVTAENLNTSKPKLNFDKDVEAFLIFLHKQNIDTYFSIPACGEAFLWKLISAS